MMNASPVVSAQLLGQSIKSKSDFRVITSQHRCLIVYFMQNYFAQCLQLYVPPAAQFDKEWIRQVLDGSKKLVPLSEMQPVEIGHYYPEVSVLNLWPLYKDRPEVKDYFPSKLPNGRSLDRAYFFNIMSTFLGHE